MWTGDFCVDMGQIIDFYSPECNSPVFNPFYNYLEALQPLIFLKDTADEQFIYALCRVCGISSAVILTSSNINCSGIPH